MVWVVVGDLSKIEAGIRELNLGEIHYIDADGNPIGGGNAAQAK
jgi:zinc protease